MANTSRECLLRPVCAGMMCSFFHLFCNECDSGYMREKKFMSLTKAGLPCQRLASSKYLRATAGNYYRRRFWIFLVVGHTKDVVVVKEQEISFMFLQSLPSSSD